MKAIPTQSKYNAAKRPDTAVASFQRKTKTEVVKDSGFTPKQAERFQQLVKSYKTIVMIYKIYNLKKGRCKLLQKIK